MGSVLFDLKDWLSDSLAFYKANRMSIGRFIPIEELPDVLSKLARDQVVKREECRELLEGLAADGLIEAEDCKFFL